MKLSEFKANEGLTYRQIGDMFGVVERTAVNWVRDGAEITGRKGAFEVHVLRKVGSQVETKAA